MKEFTNAYSDENVVDNTVHSLDRIILAVVVTGLLYLFNIGSRQPEPIATVSDSGASIVNLSEVTADKVLQEVSADSGLPKSDLQIVKTRQPMEESAICDRGSDRAACPTPMEPALHIIVASKEQRWVYRLNQSGSKVQLEKVSTSTVE